MKFPVNTQKIVLWGLLAFYIFIIVSYFWARTREGLTTETPSLGDSSTPTPSTTPSSTETKPVSSGTNQDKIDDLIKKIGELDKKKHDYETELNDLKKTVPNSDNKPPTTH
jgi:hypothetical protein